jgi:cation diffusion facilitator CzcD-associated flavoprotein CzcO
LENDGWPEISLAEFMERREKIEYGVMERLRQRVENLVADKETAETLKPYYRFLCKRPCSNDDYYPTLNRPNVKLIDVSASKGVERMTEKGFVSNGVEYEIDCMIFASGFEVTSDLDRRWGITSFKGRDGKSIYEYWGNGPKTLHGVMTHDFPNQFFIGFIQGALNASTTEQFNAQALHVAYVVGETMRRGAKTVEPSVEAQEAYVQHFSDVMLDTTQFQRECTPSYFTNEGQIKAPWALFRSYGPGWAAFQKMLSDWRDTGKLDGLQLR